MPARPIREERQRWYVYLLLKHFKGDTTRFARVMDISKRSIDQWKEHHYEDMKEFIKKERKCDRNGEDVPFEEREVPTAEALREECLKLRDDGMAIGMIDKTCYGIPKVAEARFKRDVAEAVYKANMEAINSIKLNLRLIESQLQREWSNESP